MSTPTQPRSDAPAAAAAPAVPRPRTPIEPRSTGPAPERSQLPEAPAGLLDRHAWLLPGLGIAATVAVFVSMILLTWAAGGATPFNR